ncbi:hypothetical protein LPB136_03900 [Tenacibaculum todarodis]|uniref:Uncharacterized protein n=1 Tax=Tenacibaculum todarodis TaxID=1850252 RepID=A0A1L3JHE4_9FLAO|nr:hypothetical protein [Tenacibaculum todarodis]APG64560.1 hypothetical protein LPB136_03900 [Tenacibaculum todarodis]
MKKEKIIPLWKLGLFIILLWILSTVLIKYFFPDWAVSATFGDTFGAINSLFSGLALAGIIYTIYLQKTELSLQREELKYTREELKRTADAQELSNKMMTEQLRINNMPFLQHGTKHQDSSFTQKNSDILVLPEKFDLNISNRSNNEAYDIDCFLILPINSNKYEPDYFVDNFIKEEYKERARIRINKSIYLTSGENYYFTEEIVCDYLPQKKEISISLKDYQIEFDNFNLMIQYRDILNNNYYQMSTFEKNVNYENSYIQTIIEPKIPRVNERFYFASSKNKIPNEIDFIFERFIHSIPNDWFLGVEKNIYKNNWVMKNLNNY